MNKEIFKDGIQCCPLQGQTDQIRPFDNPKAFPYIGDMKKTIRIIWGLGIALGMIAGISLLKKSQKREKRSAKAEVKDWRALNKKGDFFRSKGNYREAYGCYMQALVIARELGDRAAEGTTLNNIGEVYHSQRKYPKALGHYQKALVIAREIGMPDMEKKIKNAISRLKKKMK